ncbi:related to short-chain dehydrogenase/reductase family protein, putative [Phialocephala subalpina]|uniref:Related to short-chain dehydrogenase/reductase family protein, putative n=1 Tax=Phialocephala subalpina TaxID=576137 RepID=A0A1L7XFJ3_9HELO|nr:related to short-chain dehydrogenase/reductase family protein, putative [Phialocephala subalpina]
MVGSKDLQPSTISFGKVFYNNQFKEKPVWPAPGTSISGKSAIITGGNTGLGYEAALQLLGLKLSNLILAVRSPNRGEAAAAKLKALYPKSNIDVWQLDMCSYDSIQAFANRVRTQLSRIDFVILNAGMMNMEFKVVKSTSHEEIFQVNYLSTMLLTVLLLPTLKAKGPLGEPAHLTIVSAALTLAAKFPNKEANPLFPSFDDPKVFDQQETYNSSKLLAHMFLWKLVDYVSADDVIVNLADPAWCKGTELTRAVTNPVLKMGMKAFAVSTGRTPKVGASCFVDAAVNKGKESHGCFLMSWKIHPFAAFLYTLDGKVVIERVWEESMNEFEFAGARSILESMKR